MAMLAEPRRKQKWTLNPRGKNWSDDSNKFGQKMLEKMGWSSGKGLGRNLDGMTEHVRARYKNDQCGIGFSNEDKAKQWTLHQDSYNDLLRDLQKDETAETIAMENELSGKSLELKSKQSRARVHYRKFTRGKDVNKYTSKDLANIFGKKDLEETSRVADSAEVEDVSEGNKSIIQPVGSTDTSYGVITIKGGSLTDYFKSKMSVLGRKTLGNEVNDVKEEQESDDDRYTGFGFVGSRVRTEESSGMEKYTFENGALDTQSPRIIDSTTGERKKDYVFENSALEVADSPGEPEREPKRRKRQFAFENAGLDLESKKICEKKPRNDCVATGENIPNSDEIVRKECCSNGEFGESSKKKSRKKRKKEDHPVVVVVVDDEEGFTNEAIDLGEDDNGSPKSQFEIPRACFGLANQALDLTDESIGKKRVTFNETVEYNVNVGKARGKRSNKNAAAAVKLDKFEVDNDKLKKKKKAGKKRSEIITIDGAFANEAMDIEIFTQEANDNVLNERKIVRARRKRDRRVSSLETIEEAPEEDKGQRSPNTPIVVSLRDNSVGEASEGLEILCLDTPKRERKKRRKNQEPDDSGMGNSDVELIREITPSRGNDDEKFNKELKPDTLITANYESRGAKKKKLDKALKNVESGRNKAGVEYNREIVEAVGGEDKRNERRKDKSIKCMDKENAKAIHDNSGTVGERKKLNRDKINSGETKRDITDQHLRKDNAEIVDESIGLVDRVTSDQTELPNASHSPWGDNRGKKSRNMFKALFAKSPVLHFAGSNINEIKGYGMDFN